MPIITSIKQQKNKNRINVYLDNKFGFGIDLDNFVLLHLKVDQELSDTEIEKIIKKAEFQKILDKLLRFATVRPRSEKEIENYFRRKKVHSSMHDDLIGKLKHFELVDDYKFANWWIEQRMSFRPKSRRTLLAELREKGISKDIAAEILENTKIDELTIAKELINKKMYRWNKLDEKDRKHKIAQYLASKGYGWEIIKKVVDINEFEE